MTEIYRLMIEQAQAWQHSWDRVISRVRGPGYGNSYGKGIGVTRYDLTLGLPPLPAMPELVVDSTTFSETYKELLSKAREQSPEKRSPAAVAGLGVRAGRL